MMVDFMLQSTHYPTWMYNLKNIPEKYFTCSLLKELFENIDATTIMDFYQSNQFLADRTNGRAIGTVLRLSSSVCNDMYCG